MLRPPGIGAMPALACAVGLSVGDVALADPVSELPDAQQVEDHPWMRRYTLDGVEVTLSPTPGPDEVPTSPWCRGGGVDLFVAGVLDEARREALGGACEALVTEAPALALPRAVPVSTDEARVAYAVGDLTLEVVRDTAVGEAEVLCEADGLVLRAAEPLPDGLDRVVQRVCDRMGSSPRLLAPGRPGSRLRAWETRAGLLARWGWLPLGLALVTLLGIRPGAAGPSSPSRAAGWSRAVVGALLLVGFVLRLGLMDAGFDTNETGHLIAFAPSAELVSPETPVNPPLFRLLVNGMAPGDPVHFGRRLSMLLGLVSIWLAARVARRASGGSAVAAVVAAAWIALDPLQVEHGALFRVYAPWVAVLLWHVDAVGRWVEGDTRRATVLAAAVSAILLPWLHHMAVPGLLVEGVWLAGTRRVDARRWLTVYGAAVLAWLPLGAAIVAHPAAAYTAPREAAVPLLLRLLAFGHGSFGPLGQAGLALSLGLALAALVAGLGAGHPSRGVLAQAVGFGLALAAACLAGMNARTPLALPWSALVGVLFGVCVGRLGGPGRAVGLGALAVYALAVASPTERGVKGQAASRTELAEALDLDAIAARTGGPAPLIVRPAPWVRYLLAVNGRADLARRPVGEVVVPAAGWTAVGSEGDIPSTGSVVLVLDEAEPPEGCVARPGPDVVGVWDCR